MIFKHSALWWIKSLLSRVPIYGQLVNSSKESFGAAVRDVFITTIFSLLPLWLYPTFLHLGFDQPFWSTLRLFIASGEFFIYSAALVGPLIYTITRTYGEEAADPNADGVTSGSRHIFPKTRSIQFPYGHWFVLISIVVCCFAALFFGVMRAKTSDVLPLQPDEDTLISASAILYVFTLSCVFCVSVYRVNLENGAREFGHDTRDLMHQWEQQHDR